MTRFARPALLPAAALFVLAACSGGDRDGESDEVARETSDDRPAQTARPASADTPAASDEVAASAIPPAMSIPSAIQGRWGLVAADCEPGRDDAKGLLTIGPRTLEFYESVGTLNRVEDSAPMRIRALFDFTGEGMEWEREMVIEAQDGGDVLVRREYGADAAPNALRYSKCS